MAHNDDGLRKKHLPSSEMSAEEVFDFPFLTDAQTVDFIQDHGRIMFIIRGPSGTKKSTLSSLIGSKYETAVTCSADSYFQRAFMPQKRDLNLLRQSHLFCQDKVKKECENGTNPIVVQNTHTKRWELNEYLEFANRYGYTVIMAVTLRKFEATAEVLEQTNTHGLTKTYLEGKLRGFQEYVPLYLGWFLCPDDQAFLFDEAKQTLENLLDDGRFCTTFNAFGEDDIWGHFKLENQLFCIATYCNHGQVHGSFRFYLKNETQDMYGKCFELAVQGFLVSPDLMLAVVAVTSDMKALMMDTSQKKEDVTLPEDSLSDMFNALNSRDKAMNIKAFLTFKEDFSSERKTAKLIDHPDDELMHTKSMSFILIAHANEKPNLIKDVQAFAKTVFSQVLNEDGAIENSRFSELNNGTRYLRLPNQFWLVSLPQKIVLSTVLTGKYA